MKEKQLLMTEKKIPSLILQLAIPNMLGLLVVSAYSLADSFFVAGIGREATAAVGLTFSLHVLMQAVGYTLGMGAGTLLSRALGKGDEQKARDYATVSALTATLLGALITLGALPFRAPILRFLGASEALLPVALEYLTPLLWSAPAMCATFVLSQLLRAQGRAVLAMLGLGIGSLFNIALDPFLINALGLGIRGASIATLISQSVAACFLGYFFLSKNSRLRLFDNFSVSKLLYLGRILRMGLPSLLRQGLSGIAAILLNRTAAEVGGDAAVSAISLVSRLFLLVFSVCLGISQGMLPVVGYNLGADRQKRVRESYRFALQASTLAMLTIGILLFLSAPQVLSLFQSEGEGIEIGVTALRAQSLVLFSHGIVTPTIFFLQACGRSYLASLLASARQGIFFLPLILLLPLPWGLLGVELAQPIADAATLLFSIPFVILILRTFRRGNARIER